jgi:hypothetical protein
VSPLDAAYGVTIVGAVATIIGARLAVSFTLQDRLDDSSMTPAGMPQRARFPFLRLPEGWRSAARPMLAVGLAMLIGGGIGIFLFRNS